MISPEIIDGRVVLLSSALFRKQQQVLSARIFRYLATVRQEIQEFQEIPSILAVKPCQRLAAARRFQYLANVNE